MSSIGSHRTSLLPASFFNSYVDRRNSAAQSGKGRLLTGPPHTTRHAGPHRAVHQRGQRGQRHFQFFANSFGRPQQRGSFFNQKNIGNASAPFGLMFYLVVVRVAEADSVCKVTSVAGGVAGQRIVVSPSWRGCRKPGQPTLAADAASITRASSPPSNTRDTRDRPNAVHFTITGDQS